MINYQCPEDEKVYLHRIGRTARAEMRQSQAEVRQALSGVAETMSDEEREAWAMQVRTRNRFALSS